MKTINQHHSAGPLGNNITHMNLDELDNEEH